MWRRRESRSPSGICTHFVSSADVIAGSVSIEEVTQRNHLPRGTNVDNMFGYFPAILYPKIKPNPTEPNHLFLDRTNPIGRNTTPTSSSPGFLRSSTATTIIIGHHEYPISLHPTSRIFYQKGCITCLLISWWWYSSTRHDVYIFKTIYGCSLQTRHTVEGSIIGCATVHQRWNISHAITHQPCTPFQHPSSNILQYQQQWRSKR